MFQKFTKGFLAMSLAALLSACSGGADVGMDTQTEPTAAPTPLATSMSAPTPQQAMASDAGASVAGQPPAVLQPAGQVTESERVAEELRMVDFEQSFSIEMNRRAQEQSERAQRAAVLARAGVVQGPGCEGTEGHAALECERSLTEG